MMEAKRKVRGRDAALSRTQIVKAAIVILDRDGEAGLTFKALAERLATGPGAIYGYIANKDDLLAAACDAIVANVMQGRKECADPFDSIKAFAVGIFDAIDERPWVGAALVRLPGQSPLVRVLDAVGQDIRALDVPADREWASTMAVFNYIVGVGGQHAANARLAHSKHWDRTEMLASLARSWSDLDAEEYPFAQSVAPQLSNHDDRADFLAGIEFILVGIRTCSRLIV
ncbi:TetR/AcrR family transcriptional regulator [Rhizobium sp. NPDC090275]|uniref:TetR/AcrR family transcriptional regulator n=1 Tax=Rhizobium sp. NPDC090275 TaxID=3364498 RepID=UPI00383A6052